MINTDSEWLIGVTTGSIVTCYLFGEDYVIGQVSNCTVDGSALKKYGTIWMMDVKLIFGKKKNDIHRMPLNQLFRPDEEEVALASLALLGS